MVVSTSSMSYEAVLPYRDEHSSQEPGRVSEAQNQHKCQWG